MRLAAFLFPVLFAVGAAMSPALAEDRPAPPLLPEVLETEPSEEFEGSFAEDKRREAMRAAALAYGAQAGLARRTWEIQRLTEERSAELDRIYRFRALTVRRHGFVVVPPVVRETREAVRFAADGSRAASAARVVRIVEGERLASAPPHWRDFLIRSWPPVEKPVSVLFPRDEAEKAAWAGWVAKGWEAGRAQADEINEADVDRLSATFEGLARWGWMHDARMIGGPDVEVSRSGVAGDGRVMRLKETLVRMGRPAELNLRPREWRLVVKGPGDETPLEEGQ